MKNASGLRAFLCLAVLSAFALPGGAQELPHLEFGIGPGFLSYGIDCSYDNPANPQGVFYGDHQLVDWDNVPEFVTWDIARPYPAEASVFALNTAFILRLPLGESFALAYSNRVSFGFDDKVHREDRYGQADDLVLTMAGMTGLEFEWYPTGFAGPWVAACAGVSVLNQPFVVNYFSQFGWAAGGTAGWRFSKGLAVELNALFFGAGIPGSVANKIEALSGTISGESSGWTLACGLRFGV